MLQGALNHPEFKKYWNLTKDQVAVCKDCEFRYICTDCRAYLEDPEDIFSKPLKCGYNPYIYEWEEWSTNPLKQKAIDYYGMRSILQISNLWSNSQTKHSRRFLKKDGSMNEETKLMVNFVLNETPSPEQLVNLYDSVGWGHKEYPQMLLKAIENSSFLVCAYADTELIALGRAISDGVFTVYFPDLLVKPEWQNKGLGSQMMNILLKHFEDFHNQVLIAEDEAARAFYLKHGFKPETNVLSIMCFFKEMELPR